MMDKQAKQYVVVGIMISLVLLISLVLAEGFDTSPQAYRLIDSGVEGMKITSFNVGDKAITSANYKSALFDLRNEFVTNPAKGKVEQKIYLKNNHGINKAFTFSTLVEINYSEIRWNGMRYQLNATPIELKPYYKDDRFIVPTIFMDDKYHRQISYKDLGEKGGYAIAYEKNGKYYIELKIDDLNIEPNEEYYIDPYYINITDGFSIAGEGVNNAMDVFGNDSTLFIPDVTDKKTYMYLKDGTYIKNVSAPAGVRGICGNTTTLLYATLNSSHFYNYNIDDGTLVSIFENGAKGAGNSNTQGMWCNTTDIYVVDYDDSKTYHTSIDGTYIDSFSNSFMGSDIGSGIWGDNINSWENSRFWMTSRDYKVFYFIYGNGTQIHNQTFENMGVYTTDIYGMWGNSSDMWTLGSVDAFVFHIFNETSMGEDFTSPSMTITYPVNGTTYASNISTLDYTFVELFPDSCWYSTNDGITNSSAVSVGTNFTSITSIEGQNNWTLFCNDTSGNENSTIVSFNKFSMDINLISPVDNTTLITTTSNFTANYTIYSGDLKNTTYYVWYENSTIFNQTLVSISGTTNETTLSVDGFQIGTYLWNTRVCAEDSGTFCFFNEVNYTLLVGISVGDETFANWTYETSEQSLSVNLTLVEDTTLVSANLVYNNTNYAVSNISIDGNEYILTRTIDTPLNPYYFSNVSNEFYWSFTYVDSGGTQSSQNTTTREQNVTYLVINICNATYPISNSHALNFTMYDELTTDRINATSNATTLRTTFNYWIGSGSVYKNYSYSNIANTTTGEYNFCIFPKNETLYTDMNMEYGAVDYSTRTYHLRDAPLDNSTNEIKLELMPDSDSVKFFIEVREGMIGFPDATVTISKYFTGEGVYRTTEIRETDVDGNFIAYLDLDQTYNFLVVKDGISYGTITEQAICTESPCELTLQIEEAVIDMWQGFYDEFAASVSYTLDYNDTLKLVTYTFNDLTGLAQYFALDVTEVEYDGPSGFVLEPSGTYCNKTLSAVTGTLTCNLTDYTKGDFKATGYISRSPEQIVDYITFVISSIKDTLGNLGLFVSFLMIIVIGLVGCWNPAVGVVLTTFAVLMMKILGFVAFSYTTVILIIIMAIILVFKMKS